MILQKLENTRKNLGETLENNMFRISKTYGILWLSMNEALSFYSLEIGKIYNTSIPRRTGIALYLNPVRGDGDPQHYISSFRPDEFFVLLARETNSNINWTKILTSNGKVGWCSWDVGKRFDEINQS